ncbi:hypothetical protein ASG75_10910 [Rhodanobacter sp. Soil772]|nr:hypothetical protein ASG75_10910 [Rhodanobacter sp. Soil772]
MSKFRQFVEFVNGLIIDYYVDAKLCLCSGVTKSSKQACVGPAAIIFVSLSHAIDANSDEMHVPIELVQQWCAQSVAVRRESHSQLSLLRRMTADFCELRMQSRLSSAESNP